MTELERLEKLPEHPAPAGPAPDRVHIEGIGGRARDLTVADLARMPQSDLTEDFVCDEGWLVPRQAWRGVLVGDLLTAAGVGGDEGWVEFGAGDFCFSEPIATARNALVALELNGAPLAKTQGGPCRLYLPGEACYTSIKWLDRIIVRDRPGPNQAAAIAGQRLAAAKDASIGT